MHTWHAQSIEEALRLLEAAPEGLSHEEAVRRLAVYGPNDIPEPPKPWLVIVFLREFRSIFVYVLLTAAALSALIGKTTDAAVVLAIVFANAAIGFAQRRRAERAIEALKNMLVATAEVIRDGEALKVPARDSVPGDIIVLWAGQRIPADARIIFEENLRVDESPLTGESFPEDKSAETLPADTPLADRTNMVFMGTAVLAGEGRAVVVATGSKTSFGEIAVSIRGIKRERTHFEKRIDDLALQMGVFAFMGAALTFGVGFLVRGFAFFDILIFSIAALVAGVPEGLPAVVAIVLAVGAWRMARRNAIVRHLSAVETLGVATVIVTDKTGTLTENTMTVEEIFLGGEHVNVSGKGWEPQGGFFMEAEAINPLARPSLKKLLEVGAVVNASRLVKTEGRYEVIGDPTEVALLVLAEKGGILPRNLAGDVRTVAELPFDHDRQWRARLIEWRETGEREIAVVGAWERLMALSARVAEEDGTSAPLTKERERQMVSGAESAAGRAMRVLAICWRPVPKHQETLTADMVAGLTLGGFLGMRDPLRPEAAQAIRHANEAGIRVIMQTGDHPLTALAIAKEAGIVTHSASEQKALTENELAAASPKEFSRALSEVNVFARITPTMKLRIVETLQQMGGAVAVTGDGVNDAPALKQADIGVSMGINGTDVAREASDIVLADDNFASIISAVEEGRVVFENVRKTSFYLLTTNVAEAVTIVVTLLLGLPLPLLPIHLLWLNLVTDGAPVIALAVEPGETSMLKEPPRKIEESILSRSVIPLLGIVAILMTAGTILLFMSALGEGIEKARTMAFTVMAFFQLANALNMRSLSRSLFACVGAAQSWLWKALGLALLLQLATLFVPPLRRLFQFEVLSLGDLLLAALVASSVIVFGELYKFFRCRAVGFHKNISAT